MRVSNPFAPIPRDDLIGAFVKAGNAHAEEFERSLSALRALLVTVDPIQVLSTLSAHGLFAGVDESGKMSRRDEASSLGQHHVELIQALTLQIPEEQFTFLPVRPDQIQDIWNFLLALGRAFDGKRYTQAADAQSEQEHAVMLVQERLRLNTHCVRNWGYFKPVISLVKDLYGPLDAHFEQEVGLSATALIRTFERLVSTVETRINRHLGWLRPAMQARSLREVIEEYSKAFPEIIDSTASLAEFCESKDMSVDSAKALCLTHAELFLRSLFIFSMTDMSRIAEVDASALAQALRKVSLSFGDLKGHASEYLFLDNPVWTRPIIRLKDDQYLCALPQTFFSFAFRILDGLLASSVSAQNACQARRASYLESEVERLITSAFPHCLSKRNFIWEEGGREYETDSIARVDSYLLIIEAKSGTISWPALRGAPARVKRHIEELFIEPGKQSQRLATRLKGLISNQKDNGLLQDLLPL